MAVNDLPVTPGAPKPPVANVYKAKDVSAPIPEYDAMRSRLSQRTNADTQQQQDAMQRRFAAQGGMNSGAAIKQQQLVAEQGVQNREQAMEGVNQQEAAQRAQLQAAESQKEFQSQEAAAGRDFTAGESKLGRDLQSSQFGSEMAFKNKVAGWENSARMEQMKLAWQRFALDKDESYFNQQSTLGQMDDDQRLGMGQAGLAYNERVSSAKGRIENQRNIDRDAQRNPVKGGLNGY